MAPDEDRIDDPRQLSFALRHDRGVAPAKGEPPREPFWHFDSRVGGPGPLGPYTIIKDIRR